MGAARPAAMRVSPAPSDLENLRMYPEHFHKLFNDAGKEAVMIDVTT